jgi:hypothetical protein
MRIRSNSGLAHRYSILMNLSALQVRFARETDRLTLENGYIKVSASLSKPAIDQLLGCFDGNGDYKSVLSETANKAKVRWPFA